MFKKRKLRKAWENACHRYHNAVVSDHRKDTEMVKRLYTEMVEAEKNYLEFIKKA